MGHKTGDVLGGKPREAEAAIQLQNKNKKMTVDNRQAGAACHTRSETERRTNPDPIQTGKALRHSRRDRPI